MSSATQTEVHAHDGPPPIDPANDIDARTTVAWLVLSAIGVFVTVWGLLHLFEFVIFSARHSQVELAPTVQIDELRAEEAKQLAPGEGRLSIEDAMRKYVENR